MFGQLFSKNEVGKSNLTSLTKIFLSADHPKFEWDKKITFKISTKQTSMTFIEQHFLAFVIDLFIGKELLQKWFNWAGISQHLATKKAFEKCLEMWKRVSLIDAFNRDEELKSKVCINQKSPNIPKIRSEAIRYFDGNERIRTEPAWRVDVLCICFAL